MDTVFVSRAAACMIVAILLQLHFGGATAHPAPRYVVLDGVASHIHIPSVVIPNGAKTIEAWVSLPVASDSLTGKGIYLGVMNKKTGNGNSGECALGYWIDGYWPNKEVLGLNQLGYNTLVKFNANTRQFTTNTWMHLVWQASQAGYRDGNWRNLANGKEFTTAFTDGNQPPTSGTGFHIGMISRYGSGNRFDKFNISSIRFSNYARYAANFEPSAFAPNASDDSVVFDFASMGVGDTSLTSGGLTANLMGGAAVVGVSPTLAPTAAPTYAAGLCDWVHDSAVKVGATQAEARQLCKWEQLMALKQGVAMSEAQRFSTYEQVRALELGASVVEALQFSKWEQMKAFELGATVAEALQFTTWKQVHALQVGRTAQEALSA